MTYTIRKIENKSIIVYRAIPRDRLGKQIKTKTFKRKTDARSWADRLEQDRDTIAAFGN